MAASWHERFLSSTRGRIVRLLRRKDRTVEEIAGALGLTDNAVRAQLTALERDGLVRQRGIRRGVRKPSFAYELDPQSEQLFAKPYPAVLGQLLSVLKERLSPEEVDAVIREAGIRLSAAAARGPRPDALAARAEAVVRLIGDLGGLAELDVEDGRHVVSGYDCLLRSVVPDHPELCRLAEALIGEAVGAPVEEHCARDGQLRCRFEIKG